MTISINPRGLPFVRVAIAFALSKGDDPMEARSIASRRWGAGSPPETILRAAVASGTYADMGSDFAVAATAFFELVAQMSVVGRMAGLRRVPLRTRLLSVVSGSTAYWVGEGKAKPVTRAVYASDSLAPLKVAGLTVATIELLESPDLAAEMTIRADMLRAIVEAIDVAFLDPANAGVADVSPASITNGIVPIAASADAGADLAALVAAFEGNLDSAYLITTPTLGASLSSADRPNVGARGGELLGIPVLTSRSAPAGAIILADAAGLAAGEGEAEIRTSRAATIEMLDAALVGDATTGAAAETVSLYQTNSVAILSERAINWQVARPGSVALITGAAY
ncbi:phage major capsid protein [Mesorhizobium sp. M0622]|uniref:phage major capsid family protein n=1 Tax=Mesorhizobium sp. M0622 TaxID=2956975 RepID=UPI00333C2696